MINLGDGQYFSKKMKEGGDPNKCPRTKSYVKNVGGLLASGIVVILAWGLCTNSAIDFFMKDISKPERRHDNNNKR